MFFVRIDGVDDDDLAFLGYVLVAEDDAFKLYRDYLGDEYIVDRQNPYLFVEDLNDAQIILSKSGRPGLIEPPPKRK